MLDLLVNGWNFRQEICANDCQRYLHGHKYSRIYNPALDSQFHISQLRLPTPALPPHLLPTSLPPKLQLRPLPSFNNHVNHKHLPALKPLPRRPLQLLRRTYQNPHSPAHLRNLLISDLPPQTRAAESPSWFPRGGGGLKREPVVCRVRVAVVDAAVVEHEDQHVHVVAGHSLDFHGREAERAVALEADDFLSSWRAGARFRGGTVVGGMCGDCVAETNAHGCVRAGVEAEARVRDGEDGAGYVHCVCAFGDVDDAAVVDRGERVQGLFDGGEGAGVGHGMGGGGGFRGGGGEVLLRGGVDVLGIWGVRGVMPGAESGGDLGHYSCKVAEERYGPGAGAIPAKFFGGNVDLDELRIGVPFGGITEVEDPI
jgi:hypothetical protein